MANYRCGSTRKQVIITIGRRVRGKDFPLYCNKVIGDNSCPYCVDRRVSKFKHQIEDMKHNYRSLLYKKVTKEESQKIKHRFSQLMIKYKAFPQEDGSVVLIAPGRSKLEGKPLPNGAELDILLKKISATPKGQRVTGSRDLGKPPSERQRGANIEKASPEQVLDVVYNKGGKSVVWEVIKQTGGSVSDDGNIYLPLDSADEYIRRLMSANAKLTQVRNIKENIEDELLQKELGDLFSGASPAVM